MAIRVVMDDGNWADVKTAAELKGSDIDLWEEFLEEVRDDALGPEPEPVPDPDNPAVMKTPERKGSFKTVHLHKLRDKLLAITIAAWSYDLPLPYSREHRAVIDGPSCRKLSEAAEPAGRMLNNNEDEAEPDPKPESGSTGSDGSSGISPENTLSPLPASRLAPSATASG